MTDINQAKKWLNDADAVIVTAGNGMAQEEGLDILSEESFDQEFGRLADKYDVHTIADALDKKFDSWSQQWAFWSQLINEYSFHHLPGAAMLALKEVLKNNKYFIATSTFGHFFENAGFNEKRIFNVFGDWTKMQCSSGINHGQKDDREVVRQFIEAGADVTEDLVPRCSICNSEMELAIPVSANFYPDTDANARFRWYLTGHEEQKVVILELGVDETSPQLLDPMVHLVSEFENWKYIAADLTTHDLPDELQKRSLAFGSNSHDLLRQLTE